MSMFWTFLASFLIANCWANAANVAGERIIFPKGDMRNVKYTEIFKEENEIDPNYYTPCPSGWSTILNSCYMFVKNQVTWDTARTDCLKRGGDLVIPTSTTQCDILSQRAAALGLSIPWIGLFRRYDGKFYNTCGKELSFTRWYPNQPDDYAYNEKCGHMLVTGKYKAKWNDMRCNAKYSYICEFKEPRCKYLAKIPRFKASTTLPQRNNRHKAGTDRCKHCERLRFSVPTTDINKPRLLIR